MLQIKKCPHCDSTDFIEEINNYYKNYKKFLIRCKKCNYFTQSYISFSLARFYWNNNQQGEDL